MEERPAVIDRASHPTLQMGIAFPTRERILDPKTRAEVVALLGRLLLEAAQRDVDGEARDDAP
jgi:hypothetical protein